MLGRSGFGRCAGIAGRRPAARMNNNRALGSGERRHDASLVIGRVGGARGPAPRSKHSMMIMRPPQEGLMVLSVIGLLLY